jgi:hypothetical protein
LARRCSDCFDLFFLRLFGLSIAFLLAFNRPITLSPSPTSQPRNITRADLVLTEGFGLEVDGRMKTVFPTLQAAQKRARDLKAEFPMLQIKVYDAAAACDGGARSKINFGREASRSGPNGLTPQRWISWQRRGDHPTADVRSRPLLPRGVFQSCYRRLFGAHST